MVAISQLSQETQVSASQERSPLHASDDRVISAVQTSTEGVFCVLNLMFAIMKLLIDQKEQEKLARREERQQHVKHIEETGANYEAQGSQMQSMAIGAGIVGILAGFMPILGHLKGDAIMGALSKLTEKFQGMETKDFFKGVSKMLMQGSEVQKQIGQVYQVKYQGKISYNENWGRLHETDGGECTRNVQEKGEAWRAYEQFNLTVLRMLQDAASSLYR